MSVNVDLKQFEEQGYFVARGVLDPVRDLEPIIREYEVLLDKIIAAWRASGELEQTDTAVDSRSFSERFCQLTTEGRDCLRFMDISLPSKTSSETPIHLGPSVFRLLRNEKLLDIMEQLIGGEIYSNPVQHIRIKPPEKLVPKNLLNGLNAAVGWHQDMGVVNPEADDTLMISVWIAVLDAPVERGCLQVVPGSHHGDLLQHCNFGEDKRRYFQVSIPDQLVPANQTPVPMKAGDALFFHKRLMHSSLPNLSDDIRWSFDLRYNRIGEPTGRAWLPGFVARSKSHPETELRDPEKWAQMWIDTRTRLATGDGIKPSSRWDSNHPLCA
jgi:hypothetical protein